MSIPDLIRTSKADFQLCVDAFYTDDWQQADALAQRLITLGQRWQEQAPMGENEAAYRQSSLGFTEAAGELRTALTERDVQKTTGALKKLATNLAVLETMQ